MSVINSLVLDHFYTNFTTEDFESLLPLTKMMRAAPHLKVETTNASWEGMYLYSRTGAYFEILREWHRPGFLGLCFSPIAIQNVDASRITQETEFEWLTLRREFKPREPWFDAYYVAPAVEEGKKLFDPWIMRYHQRHVDYTKRPVKRSIDRFERLHLTLGRENLSVFAERGPWMPIAPLITEDQVVLEITDRDGFTFKIEVDLEDGNGRFGFKSLSFYHCDPEAFENLKVLELGRFRLTCEDRLVTLAPP